MKLRASDTSAFLAFVLYILSSADGKTNAELATPPAVGLYQAPQDQGGDSRSRLRRWAGKCTPKLARASYNRDSTAFVPVPPAYRELASSRRRRARRAQAVHSAASLSPQGTHQDVSGLDLISKLSDAWLKDVDELVRAKQADVYLWAEHCSMGVQKAADDLTLMVSSTVQAASSWVDGQQGPGTGLPYAGAALSQVTDTAVHEVVDIVKSADWQHVTTAQGVTVWRSSMPSGQDGGGQFACVKASGVINAPADVVFQLFMDNARVQEYNEHCREVRDLERLSANTKVTWAASGKMGPFKARDFCTLVHTRDFGDGTRAQISRPVEHPLAPRSSQYVRSEILLAGNFMRPLASDPSKTEFLTITQVNPGRVADSRVGSALMNRMCADVPVNFIRRLEAAAQRFAAEQDVRETAKTERQSLWGPRERAAVTGEAPIDFGLAMPLA